MSFSHPLGQAYRKLVKSDTATIVNNNSSNGIGNDGKLLIQRIHSWRFVFIQTAVYGDYTSLNMTKIKKYSITTRGPLPDLMDSLLGHVPPLNKMFGFRSFRVILQTY